MWIFKIECPKFCILALLHGLCKYSNKPKHGALQYTSITKATLWELESNVGDTNH